VTVSSKHLQGQLSPPLDPRSATRALWLVTNYRHKAAYGHGRNHPGESQRDQATPLWSICRTTLPVDAGSHRHAHLIDAGSMYRTKPFMHQQAYALTRTAKQFRF
jgi:hypothetical protein